ncbi:hypothetical protein G5I_05582 [Acromyrmex echinatior]|uniref:Uncharacterized protein n=1 Tax=Acromyrmex echinatior TaxID=103372 RepID=F4WIQ8_ACREC|nr:hypothetical protein G5I_05582 [Acromyrmex echinatior]
MSANTILATFTDSPSILFTSSGPESNRTEARRPSGPYARRSGNQRNPGTLIRRLKVLNPKFTYTCSRRDFEIGSAVPADSGAVVGTRVVGAIVGGPSERLDERVVKDSSQGFRSVCFGCRDPVRVA